MRNYLNHQTKKRVLILHLKIIHMTERTGSSPTMLSVCRSPHFDSWQTNIQEARRWLTMNIEAQSTIHEILHWRWRGSEGAWCTIRNSSSSSSLPSKYFSWGLSLNFFWLTITSLAAVFFAPHLVWWCCHKAGDTYCRKNLFVVECKLQSEKFRFNTKKCEIKELFDPELFSNTNTLLELTENFQM